MIKRSRKNSINPKFIIFALITIVILAGFAVAIMYFNTAGRQDVRSNAAPRNFDAPSSITLNEDPATLKLGSPITFTVIVNSLRGSEYPMVYVACYQGDSLVYGQLDHPNVTFYLGGGSSQWWYSKGPANCVAKLMAYGGKSKGYDTIRELASTPNFLTQ